MRWFSVSYQRPECDFRKHDHSSCWKKNKVLLMFLICLDFFSFFFFLKRSHSILYSLCEWSGFSQYATRTTLLISTWTEFLLLLVCVCLCVCACDTCDSNSLSRVDTLRCSSRAREYFTACSKSLSFSRPNSLAPASQSCLNLSLTHHTHTHTTQKRLR